VAVIGAVAIGAVAYVGYSLSGPLSRAPGDAFALTPGELTTTDGDF
jgi:hypothetical protein